MPENPGPLAIAANGNLLIADDALNEILERLPDGAFETIAGTGRGGFSGDGGPATQAALDQPEGMVAAGDGTIYVADQQNDRVRAIAPDGTITTIAGDGQTPGPAPVVRGGPATATAIGPPAALAIGPNGLLYIATSNSIVVLAADGSLSMVADQATFPQAASTGADPDPQCVPDGLAFDGTGDLYMTCENTNELLELTAAGSLVYRGILRPHDTESALTSTPTGSVLGLWQGSVQQYTATTQQQLGVPWVNVGSEGFWPTGVAVTPAGTMYFDQAYGGGVGPPAIVEYSGSGYVKVLWYQVPPTARS